MGTTANAKRVNGSRIAAIALSSMLVAGGVGAGAAYADETQTGTGATSLVLKLYDTAERGGTGAPEPYVNPDGDGDGLGDNLAFTVPVRIDFGVLADGTLVGPSANVAYIENESKYSVHVSALDADAKNGWNIVSNASASNLNNSIDLQVGPAGDALNTASYLNKSPVSKPAQWNMAAAMPTGTDDRVLLTTSGHVNHVDQDIRTETTFGQLNWYVTPGAAS